MIGEIRVPPKHSNTAGALGLVHQFWVALEKCNSLSPDEVLLIETEGDISVEGRFQMELKHMASDDSLTSSDLNLWNTLKNWMDDGFNPAKYRYLILRTTEAHSNRSIFRDWNFESSLEARLKIVKDHVARREADYSSKCEAAKSVGEKEPEPSESLKLMRYVVALEREERLYEVARKFYIEDHAPDINGTYDNLKRSICMGVTQKNQKAFLDSLAGFIIRPELSNNAQWEITYAGYKAKFEETTRLHCSHNKRFPKRHRHKLGAPLTSEQESNRSALFVQKIEDIDHHAKVPRAIQEHYYAFRTILEDFQIDGVETEAYLDFEDQVERDFTDAYEAEHGDYSKCSKQFYDKHTGSTFPAVAGYEEGNKDFRNGVLHMQMNDPNKSHQWNLHA